MKKQKMDNKESRKNNGITLIALVITIIVLLILAGVTIATLTGENGILTRASEAKGQTTIGEEKETVQLAYESVFAEELGGTVSADKLEKELEKTEGTDNVKVTGTTTLKVHFLETDHYYTIENGTVNEYVKPELTDVYVALYNDGTLVFSNNMDDFDDSRLEKTYEGNFKETLFDWDAPWGDDWKDILSIEIINKIVPKYTAYWFNSMNYATDIKGLNNLDTSNVETMAGMFDNCTELQTLDVSHFDTSNVTDMSCMFEWCTGLSSLDLSNFDTSNVVDMSYMFDWCENLTDLNLSNFDTSKLNNMEGMFSQCLKLVNLDLSNFSVESIENAEDIFYRVPTSVAIKTNTAMKEWLNTNYPSYTNINP